MLPAPDNNMLSLGVFEVRTSKRTSFRWDADRQTQKFLLFGDDFALEDWIREKCSL